MSEIETDSVTNVPSFASGSPLPGKLLTVSLNLDRKATHAFDTRSRNCNHKTRCINEDEKRLRLKDQRFITHASVLFMKECSSSTNAQISDPAAPSTSTFSSLR